jgi:hypothetical protein
LSSTWSNSTYPLSYKLGVPSVDSTLCDVDLFPFGNFGTSHQNINSQLVSFYSQEEIFQGFSNIKIGDFVDLVGKCQTYVTYTMSGDPYPATNNTDGKKNSIKYRNTSMFGNAVTKYRFTVDSCGFYTSVNNPTQRYSYSAADGGVYISLFCFTS